LLSHKNLMLPFYTLLEGASIVTKPFLILNIVLILFGLGLYGALIVSNMEAIPSVLLAELASLAVCFGGISMLRSLRGDE